MLGNDTETIVWTKNILSVFAANLSKLVRTGPEEKQMKIPYVFHILENWNDLLEVHGYANIDLFIYAYPI